MSRLLGMKVRYEASEAGKEETNTFCVECFFREGVETNKALLDQADPVYGWTPIVDEDLLDEDPLCCERCKYNLRELGRSLGEARIPYDLRYMRDRK